jgi:hypothetical protein
MKGDYFICANCGKLGWMEQWLINEKMELGSKLFCSHICGQTFHSEHPEEHPHTKKMIKQIVDGY